MLSLAVKPFSYFLFFKIFYGFMYDNPFPIMIAILMSIAIMLVDFMSMKYVAGLIASYKVRINFGTENDDFNMNYAKIALIAIIISITVSYFIAFGFDQRFFDYYIKMKPLFNNDSLIFIFGIVIASSFWSSITYWAAMKDIEGYRQYINDRNSKNE